MLVKIDLNTNDYLGQVDSTLSLDYDMSTGDPNEDFGLKEDIKQCLDYKHVSILPLLSTDFIFYDQKTRKAACHLILSPNTYSIIAAC